MFPKSELGSCRKLDDPSIFFLGDTPGRSGPGTRRTFNRAKNVCSTCPVQCACLEYAMSDPQTDGVWGGTTQDERRAILRLQKKSAGEPVLKLVS